MYIWIYIYIVDCVLCGINFNLCYNTYSYVIYTIAKRRDDMIPPIYHGLQKKDSVSPKKLPLLCWIFLKLNTCPLFPGERKNTVCSANYVFFAQKEYVIVFVLDQREKHTFSWGRQKMAKHAFVFLFCRRTPTNTFLNLVVKLFQSTLRTCLKSQPKTPFSWVQGLHFGKKKLCEMPSLANWNMDPRFKRENSLRFC